jgi:hypothetical protein
MMNDSVKSVGELTIVLRDAFGAIKQQATVPNMVVYTGKVFITESMAKTTNSPAAMSHMAMGSSNVPVVSGHTGLLGEFVGGTNIRASMTTTVTGNSIAYVATFAAGNCTGAITEAGIFNDVSAGTMLARTVFGVFNKDASDSLTVTWTITNI